MKSVSDWEYDFPDEDDKGEATLDVNINGVKLSASGPMVAKILALASCVFLAWNYMN